MPASMVEHTRFIHAQERRARVRAALSATAPLSAPRSKRTVATCLKEEPEDLRPMSGALQTVEGEGDSGAWRAPVVSLVHARREHVRRARLERRYFSKRVTLA